MIVAVRALSSFGSDSFLQHVTNTDITSDQDQCFFSSQKEKNLFYLAGTLQQHKYDFSSETSMKEKISKGNYVDTAPKTSFNLRWINLISNRLKSEFEVENLGSYYTDAANLHKYEGHTLLHFRLLVSNKDNLKQFIRIHNLLNEDYAERADFNSYGGDRYFPGLPRQVYFGLEYTF